MARRFVPGRRARQGFTLIEILIALVVLFIGIVGIIALFPIGIRSTKESVEDTNAALIAESVHHSLVQALRSGRPVGNPPRTQVTFVHDGVRLTAGVPGYVFQLPPRNPLPLAAAINTPPEWHHPGGNPVPAGGPADPTNMPSGLGASATARPGDGEVFLCGNTQAGGDVLRSTIRDIRGDLPENPAAILPPGAAPPASDVTLDYGQYAYDYIVSTVFVLRGGVVEALPLCQFRIRVFRNYTPGDFNLEDKPIHEFRVLIASNS
ncbi:MAG: prepilin-type N-terminal cleavage/methylation domain-containing protein [Planctomycetes bacterium]|nr:prepilin-type N-terminal cleavage/methylation domain-containing protein [Planctomycetota bacterium]